MSICAASPTATGSPAENGNMLKCNNWCDAAFAHDPPEFRLPLLNEFHALVVAVGKHHCGPQASL